ncbi:MAG TPA: glycosyltransferase [Acidobacteriaceae bacterium]|jgi:glycosyltransferase involved in cell wall biosynthesis|nr:glycosyltransferase [Acidobacteriaceae bacterium]
MPALVDACHAEKCREPVELPLVSIVITCHNCATFIIEAVESALGQTWTRIEVIVVDDGSEDNSAELVSRYPIQLVRTVCNGVSAARNRGLQESKGEYVVFLDGDDRLLRNAVSAGILHLRSHRECCMAVGSHAFVTDAGVLLCERRKPVRRCNYYARLLRSNFIECISSVIFRRDSLVSAGGFDVDLRVSEDYDLYLRLVRRHAICCYSETVSDYRLHQGNTSRKTLLMLKTTLRVHKSQRPYVFSTASAAICYLLGWFRWRWHFGRQLTRDLLYSSTPVGQRMPDWYILAAIFPPGAFLILLSGVFGRSATRLVLGKTAISSGSLSTRDKAASASPTPCSSPP